MNNEQEVRNQLIRMLTVRQAHMDFEDAVANFPEEHINSNPPNCDYTFWHLVEHIRICQLDILEYIESDEYVWPDFPADFWPEKTAVATPQMWHNSIDQFLSDRRKLVNIIDNSDVDLFAPLPNSREHEHNILREINIIASHNAYHIGELGIMRQVMGLWSNREGEI